MKETTEFGLHLALAATLLLTAVSALAQALPITRVVVYEHPPALVERPTERVAGLINQLAEESPQRREAARALREMGPSIEPQLRWALQQLENKPDYPWSYNKPNSPELHPNVFSQGPESSELAILLSHFEELRLRQGSHITLHYQDEPVTNVLRDLGKQAETDVLIEEYLFSATLDWVKTNRIFINLTDATFWDTLRALAKSAGVVQTMNHSRDGGEALTFRRGFERENAETKLKATHSTASGPFLITPVTVEWRRSIEFGSESESNELRLTLQIWREPKLRNTGWRKMIQLTECVDDDGQSLLAEGQTFSSSQQDGDGSVTIVLNAPRSGRKIKSLKGTAGVAISPGYRFLSITNLMRAEGATRDYDGLRLAIAKAKPATRIYAGDDFNEIFIDISAPTNSPLAFSFSNFAPDSEQYLEGLTLYDERRQPIRMGSLRSWWMTAHVPYMDVWRGESRFQPPSAGYRFGELRREGTNDVARWIITSAMTNVPSDLTWQTPSETRWLSVPFELRDLTIPGGNN